MPFSGFLPFLAFFAWILPFLVLNSLPCFYSFLPGMLYSFYNLDIISLIHYLLGSIPSCKIQLNFAMSFNQIDDFLDWDTAFVKNYIDFIQYYKIIIS